MPFVETIAAEDADGEVAEIYDEMRKTLHALGVAPDAAYADLPSEFREPLTVGRPIETA